MVKCPHHSLYIDCSPAAEDAGFKRPPINKRLAAITQTGRRARGVPVPEEEAMNDPWTLPGPLVLPDDDLALDPDDNGQGFKEWHDMGPAGNRNQVTARKRKLYVILPPTVHKDMEEMMKDWHKPVLLKSATIPGLDKWTSSSPQIDDMLSYLRAFYCPMEVIKSPLIFTWRPWQETSKAKTRSRTAPNTIRIGLETPGKPETYAVRCRPSLDGRARMQAHLGDVTDALLARMPSDAFSVVMLTDLDLYEDEDDDFTVGRSWGRSRVSIVSSFRYNPSLDVSAGIDRAHMWPNSHCKAFVDEQCSIAGIEQTRPAKRTKQSNNETHGKPPADCALGIAAQAAKRLPKLATRDELASYWFARLGVTTSHEIGHCFGFAHCPYYACVMQGVSSIRQDGQVPPYLCPICSAKLAWELGPLLPIAGSRVEKQQAWVGQQYMALKEFCGRWSHVPPFAGFEAWLGKRLEDMKEKEKENAAEKPEREVIVID
ncbi:hypothetical protein F53441_2177 [Fusarium austroafricanum]|uniref:Archaemetzincin-2 n=1 Tax=Fusarium austroafricanum TaxID=2364996 RepID=A0A8H4KQD9_9HYPO|nr:hypothetical protein F53441_2177 [Fusarium austroafricanum]